MNLFKRLFKIGEAESHSALDKLEDPIKMTEQGIRDMKTDLDKALQGLAEVKALAIRSKNDTEKGKAAAEDYEKKAMLILQRASKGEMDGAEADRLASEALVKKEENLAMAAQSAKQRQMMDGKVAQLEVSIKQLRSNISSWENELKTLKARVTVSNATVKLNKQLAQMDSSDTVSMLERMKDKVEKNEALADAYGDIANEARTLDQELDKALEGSAQTRASGELAALKAKMGLGSAPPAADAGEADKS